MPMMTKILHSNKTAMTSLLLTDVTCANFSQNTFPISVTLFATSSTGFREHLLEQCHNKIKLHIGNQQVHAKYV